MKLNLKSIGVKSDWADIDVTLPQFDINKLREDTKLSPEWLHFGGGNIFRVFIAAAVQDAIENSKTNSGIVVAESFDYEVIDKLYKKTDNLSLSVIMNSDGSFDKRVIASITETLKCIVGSEDYERLKEIARNPSLKIISFTITEKGYGLKGFDGEYFNVIKSDITNGPKNPKHTMSIVASLLFERYNSSKGKIAMVSMDNCSHNGEKLGAAVKDIARMWAENDLVDNGFLDYINDDSYVSFPITMIDKITPRPAESVMKSLSELGLDDMDIIITDKKTYTAPFVNAETVEYLIIEDEFPNGKVDIATKRIIFTDYDTVNNVETMKVTTCLNPLHTALAVTGCLLGHTLIYDQMQDNVLVSMVKRIGYDEGLPVVLNPGIIDPKVFIDEVVNERFSNPYIPDTPQRIATDTSQKMAIRFCETIKSYIKNPDLDENSLVAIPLVIASWCRYLLGLDDKGNSFEISPDPMKDVLTAFFDGIKLGDKYVSLQAILSNEKIFGMDLYNISLGKKIEEYFSEMIEGIGAVRKTLSKHLL